MSEILIGYENTSMSDKIPIGKSPLKVALNLGLADLVEVEAQPSPHDLELLNQLLKSIEIQLDTKAMPKALIAEQLVNLKSRMLVIGERDPLSLLFASLKDRLVSDSVAFTLSDEVKARLESKLERPLIASVIQAHVHTVSVNKQAVLLEPKSPPTEFSSLVRSVDERRKGDTSRVGRARTQCFGWLKYSLTSLIALLITLLLTISFVSYHFLAATPEQKLAFLPISQSESELRKLPDSPLALPSFEPIKNIGTLSSLAYELQGKLELSRKANPAPLPERNDQPHRGPERLNIGAGDEPALVRELQVKPESKVEENHIDFPPFRSAPVAGVLKAPPSKGAGHLVERFDVPRPFTATIPTDIMPRPSYYGASIGALRSGERISVDALIGPWVRFRFRDGRHGFVLAQDVVNDGN